MSDDKRGRGRPPLDDGEETERITARVTAGEYDGVTGEAEHQRAKLGDDRAKAEGWVYNKRPSVGAAARAMIRFALSHRAEFRRWIAEQRKRGPEYTKGPPPR